MKIIRESCVESAIEIAACAGFADRIELCSRLDAGGFTPSREQVNLALARGHHIAAMIRNRADFLVSSADLEKLRAEIRELKATGVRALVFGFLTAAGEIDFSALKILLAEMRGNVPPEKRQDAVFHMAFDELSPAAQFRALDALADLGFARILTKGGTGKAENNVAQLQKLHAHARGRLTILVGGNVSDNNYLTLAAQTGAAEFHGRKLGFRAAPN